MGTPGACTVPLPSLLSIKREQTSHRYQSRCQGDLEQHVEADSDICKQEKKKPVTLTVIKQQCLEIAQAHLTVGQH